MEDPALPALVAAEQMGWERVLRDCGIPDSVDEAIVRRHHPGSRCTVELVTQTRGLVLKAFRRSPAREADLLAGLAAAGLVRRNGPTVPRLLGVSVGFRCLVTDRLEGPSASELLRAGRGDRLGRLAVHWLATAADATGGSLPDYDGSAMIGDLWRWCDQINRADQRLGRQAAATIDGLVAQGVPSGRRGIVHRSFSVSHVIEVDGAPGVVDWDGAAAGPVELDAGAFLASLSTFTLRNHEQSGAAEAAAAVLVASRGHVGDPSATDWFRRAALVKHAKHACKVGYPDWRAVATGLLAIDGT